ncbi:MAG: hypothetical protein PVF47_07990 [Anaerolineae bacterium]|jgi:peptidoglycan/LPS O-acetylase OafA/YrhL
MNRADAGKAPPLFRRSRTKLWLRSGILAIFGTLFGLALYQDVASGRFSWAWALAIFLPCLVAGYGMSRLVPMQVHRSSEHITLSFDGIYFAVILFLVAVKAVAGWLPGLGIWADVVMCIILGLMIGRLSGICLRVRALKIEHAFVPRPADEAAS